MDHNDVVHKKLEWMIPNDGPDITSIHRIQSAYPDLFVNNGNHNHNNILDSIVCQVRLKVEKKISTTTGSSVALFDASSHPSSITTTTPSSPSPKNACCTNNPFTTTDFVIWTLETLNRHGEPTLPIPNSFLVASRNDKSNDTNDNIVHHPQHELYIVFHTHEHSIPGNRPLAIGVLSSLSNTTTNTSSIHTLRWMTSPMNFPTLRTSMLSILQQSYKRGHVSIHFQYSLGMGCIPPPYKHTLLHGGAIQTYYLCPNVIVPSIDNAHFDHDIDIDGKTDDVALRNDYTILNLESFQIPTIPHRLSSYDILLAYGDSVLEQLIASQRCNSNNNNNNNNSTNPSPQQQPARKIHFGPKIASPLNPRTLVTLLDGFDTFLQPFVQCSTGDTPAKSSIAVLLNSALWDVLSDEATIGTATTPHNEQELSLYHHQHNDPWEEHISTLRQYVRCIQQRYPIIQHIYWVLPTAVHIHRVHVLSDPSLLVKAPQKIARTKYMSSSRTFQLYQRQKDVMVSLMNDSKNKDHVDVTCLDIYEATYLSADWTLPGDGRHYRPELNERMLSWFY